MSEVVWSARMPESRIDASNRRRLRQAVMPGVERPAPKRAADATTDAAAEAKTDTDAADSGTNAPADQDPLAAVCGLILDAGPQLLVIATSSGDEARLPMTDDTSVWYAGKAGRSELRPGRRVVVRPTGDGLAAERIWVDIVRATGTIVALAGTELDVDEGPHRGRTHVVIPPHTLSHVMVRHPHFEPGYLIDVIGVRSTDGMIAVRPATPQPDYPADNIPRQRPAGPVPSVLEGTATWFAGTDRQAAYPALDPSGGGCRDAAPGCAGLPYLSIGSELHVRNECTGRAQRMPVTQCGCMAARFCDRCVECDTSPRGRIVELSPMSFVDLGGDLDAGCFNVTVRVG
jgi:hypothetical protein